jgi:hypothetical protein
VNVAISGVAGVNVVLSFPPGKRRLRHLLQAAYDLVHEIAGAWLPV